LEKVYFLAIQRDPTFAPAYAARGQLLASEADLNKALELEPEFIDAMMARGRLHMLERPAQAVNNFTQAIKQLKANTDNVQIISGVQIKLECSRNLCYAFHDRAMAQLLQGNRESALEDMNHANAVLAEVASFKNVIVGSGPGWLLQLAWVSVVHPDEKVRNVPFAEQCVSLAKENARKELGKNQGNLRTAYQFEIIKAAIAAEKGNFARALELESKVKYGKIPWADPGNKHNSRKWHYENNKSLRSKSFWYL